MPNHLYTISRKDLFDLFGRLSAANRVIVPYRNNERLFFGDFDPAKESSIELGSIRQSQPAKSFLARPRESVLDAAQDDARPLILAGVKGCDLESLIVQDHVFLQGDFEDPLYAKNRSDTTIIASDCTLAKETCFCVAMDGAPYPRKSYDMALADIGENFLVEVATEKGKKIADDYSAFFSEATSRDADIRTADRERVTKEIRDFIKRRGTPDCGRVKGAVKGRYNDLALWQDLSSTCVECGACNLVCPTCHCFLLFDEKGNEGSARRMRIWDSCLYNTFARVAGGANPRRHLYERLRNRFDKKFDFFPATIKSCACTGCGRCIEACPGDIDIREVLKGLVSGKWNKPPHD